MSKYELMMKSLLTLLIFLMTTERVLIYAQNDNATNQKKLIINTREDSFKHLGIKSLMPSSEKGHHFVVYGDSCSGAKTTGAGHEENFASINGVLARLDPMPQFICFLGDNIAGGTSDYDNLRQQWHYWINKEMAWLNKSVPVYNVTSNHNTYDVSSERVFREIFADIPSNGPPDQKGLAYFIRRDDLLLVFTNTFFSGAGGGPHVEHDWLDRVLTQNQDARLKIVLGHHPILPVNGYGQYWTVPHEEGELFWNVLARHGVCAYLCSHIIAFDVRVQQGVLQILTGGAGTNFGPGGFMPGQTEYLHFVQMVLDLNGLRYQVVDKSGNIRETLCWPLSIPPIEGWMELSQSTVNDLVLLRNCQTKSGSSSEELIILWQFSGQYPPSVFGQEQTFICGWDMMEGPQTLWIGLDCLSRLTVHLIPVPGGGIQIWQGPYLPPKNDFDVQIAIHTGMGPGGIMWRAGDTGKWSSLVSSSSRGAERTAWPTQWMLKQTSIQGEKKFLGKTLKTSFKVVKKQKAG